MLQSSKRVDQICHSVSKLIINVTNDASLALKSLRIPSPLQLNGNGGGGRPAETVNGAVYCGGGWRVEDVERRNKRSPLTLG